MRVSLHFSLFVPAIFLLLLIPAFAEAATTNPLLPVADGTDDSADWRTAGGTACNGADCFTEVDDASGAVCTDADGDGSYIVASANGASQTFSIDISDIPNNSTITQVDISVCHKRGSAPPPNNFQTRRCIDGSCVNSGTNIGAAGNYTETAQSHSGLSVPKTSATEVEIGAAITDTRNKNVRISKLYGEITYTPPACSDGIDNDGDGETDYPEDDGCDSASDDDETDPAPEEPPDDTTTDTVTGPGTGVRRITFEGQAYPGATIDVLRKNSREGSFGIIPEPDRSFSINESGAFRVVYEGLVGGEYFFALRGTDAASTTTGILSFGADLRGVNLQTSRFTATGLLLPPTLTAHPAVASSNSDITFSGYAAPEAAIFLEANDARATTTAGSDGAWSAAISAGMFDAGVHHARVRQTTAAGEESSFSRSRAFRVSTLSLPRADFNSDNRITITDWSIFLTRWGATSTPERKGADMNDDGQINISDVSIFLHAMQEN